MRQSVIDNPTNAEASDASTMENPSLQQKENGVRHHALHSWLGKPRVLSAWLGGQLEENKPKGAIASLDGVRAIACLIVITYHIGLMTRNTLWTVNIHPLTTAIVLSGGAGV